MSTPYSTQFGVLRGAPIWNKYYVTADGTPTGLNASCVFGGVLCVVAGTIAGIYDGAGAAIGQNLTATAIALTQGQRIDFGEGIQMYSGVYLDITGGTYLILAMPSA